MVTSMTAADKHIDTDDLPIMAWIKEHESKQPKKPKRRVIIYPEDEACDNPRRPVRF